LYGCADSCACIELHTWTPKRRFSSHNIAQSWAPDSFASLVAWEGSHYLVFTYKCMWIHLCYHKELQRLCTPLIYISILYFLHTNICWFENRLRRKQQNTIILISNNLFWIYFFFFFWSCLVSRCFSNSLLGLFFFFNLLEPSILKR
jgi:hypothetical protein